MGSVLKNRFKENISTANEKQKHKMRKLKDKYDREGVQFVQNEDDMQRPQHEAKVADKEAPERFSPMTAYKHHQKVQDNTQTQIPTYSNAANPYANILSQYKGYTQAQES